MISKITTRYKGTLIIGIWCGLLLILYAFLSIKLSTIMTDNRNAALQRHQARMDPNGHETGKTKADVQLPETFSKKAAIQVTSGIYVDRIYGISTRENRWNADFYIWFLWEGDIESPGKTFQVIDGQIISKKLETKKLTGNQHYELYRVQTEHTKHFNTTRFPRDNHLMTIRIEDKSNPFYQMVYVPDVSGSNLSSRVKISGYKIYHMDLVEKKHSYKTRRGDPQLPEGYKATYSQLVYGVWIKRAGWGLYFKMFIGVFASVAISLIAFLISPAHNSPRFGVGVGAFFAAVASTYVVSRQLPLSSIFGLTEYVTGVSLISIFLTILTSAISVGIYHRLKQPELSRRFDYTAQIVFLSGYLVLNILLAQTASL